MTQPIHLIADFYAVEVPEGAHGFDINKYGNCSELNYWLIAGSKETLIVTDLPPGNWQLICTTKECSPEQAAELVDYKFLSAIRIVFRNYKGDENDYSCEISRDSLRSLLTSKGLDLNKNYVLIKKKS